MSYRLAIVFAAALSALIAPAPSSAQDYPTKPVRIVVPFAPGAGNDLMGRLVANELQTRLGQSVYVENKAGAGSQIGIDQVAKSAPDGYSLAWVASDGISILPAVKSTVPYRVPDDFSFIARVVQLPFVVAVNPKLPIKSLAELVAYGKANPGKLRFGSAGIGGAPHMATALLAKTAGIELVHVPYGGVAPAVTALLGGFIDMVVMAAPSLKQYSDAGTVRVLAVTSAERYALFPDLPTLDEAGMSKLSVVFFQGLVAPAGTPEPVLARLRKATADMFKDPALVEKLRSLGYEPSYLDGSQFRDVVVKELEQWRSVAKSANISIAD